jgi:integrase/recombinase XerD
MYSITPVLHAYKNKQSLQLITFQIIVDRVKINVKTPFKVKEHQFKNLKVCHHDLAEKYNYQLNKQRLELEHKLLNAFKHHSSLSKIQLDEIIKGKVIATEKFTDFTYSVIDECRKHKKLSEGRLKRYEVIINKVNKFNDNTKLAEINGEWLTRFEMNLRATNISNATIVSNIKVIQAIVRVAKRKKIIPSFDFDSYVRIKLDTREPDFLTEEELSAFVEVCKLLEPSTLKTCGYYFLLSCYTGLRISDVMKFNHTTAVRKNELVIYAQKNKKRCAIPFYTDLHNVLAFIKENPCKLHEETLRRSVRVIAKEAEIKKYVKFHTSRHTFCTRMLQLGFTIPEVADMAGDTIETISRTYAHVDRDNIKRKVSALLG